MIEIPISQGKIALIDEADWDLVSGFKWRAHKGPRDKTYYAIATVRRADGSWTAVKMHRLILGLTDPAIKTDHRDKNGLNNKRGNLRACSNAENLRNRGANSNNTSGFKGVSWDKQNWKWRARIRLNRKLKSLGYYDTPEAAYAAYCAAAKDLHGEFHNLGTPPAKRWTKPAFEYVITGAQR